MAIFKLPLSGDVTQTINPWTWFFNPMQSQFGLININMGRSSDPEIEEEVLTEVASYGKQLGRLGEAMEVLLDHFHPQEKLKPHEEKAVAELRDMLAEIARVKAEHHSRV